MLNILIMITSYYSNKNRYSSSVVYFRPESGTVTSVELGTSDTEGGRSIFVGYR